MIRKIIVLAGLLLAIIAAPAFAHDPQHAKDCAKEGEKIIDSHTRNLFLESCLEKIDMTAFQMAEKAEHCDQNAKNMKLEGLKKDEYLEHCYLEDDTHPNPKQKPHPIK